MMSDIQNLREIVAKFDELQSDLEVVSEKLDENFNRYNNISNASSDTVSKITEILKAINTLQINAENVSNEALQKTQNLLDQMGKYYSAEYIKTKKNFKELLSSINSSIVSLNDNIQYSIENSAQYIDISPIKNKLDKRIDEIADSITEIKQIGQGIEDEYIEHANQIEQKLNNLDKLATQKTQNTAKKIKVMSDEIEEFENKLKSIKSKQWIIPTTVGLSITVGLAIGAWAIGQYASHQLQIISDRSQKITKLEKEVENLNKMRGKYIKKIWTNAIAVKDKPRVYVEEGLWVVQFD